MEQARAEQIGAQALAWLAGDPELLEIFLSSGGLGVGDLAEIASNPDFLAAVLDFLLLADSHVTGFCDAQGLAYDMPMRARQALPGGADVNWT